MDYEVLEKIILQVLDMKYPPVASRNCHYNTTTGKFKFYTNESNCKPKVCHKFMKKHLEIDVCIQVVVQGVVKVLLVILVVMVVVKKG